MSKLSRLNPMKAKSRELEIKELRSYEIGLNYELQEPLVVVDPKLNAAVLPVAPPNDIGFVAPKEKPEDCVVVVAAEAVALPKENNGFVVPAAVPFAVVEADPKINPVPVSFEPPNIFCRLWTILMIFN